MLEVQSYLDAYQELKDLDEEKGNGAHFDHCQGIFIAAVVAYCRCFIRSESQGNASPKVDLRKYKIFEGEPELEELHGRLLTLRHKTVAHADWHSHKTELVEVEGSSTLRRFPLPKYTTGIDIDEFRRLAKHVEWQCGFISYDLDSKRAGEFHNKAKQEGTH